MSYFFSPRDLFIDNISFGIEKISDYVTGFKKYQYDHLYKYYDNFLDYICTWLYDDSSLDDFINKHGVDLEFDKRTIDSLRKLDIILSRFFDQCNTLSDAKLICCPEWKEFGPITRQCLFYLKKERNKKKQILFIKTEGMYREVNRKPQKFTFASYLLYRVQLVDGKLLYIKPVYCSFLS